MRSSTRSAERAPDVVLMDIRMPGSTASRNRRIRAAVPAAARARAHHVRRRRPRVPALRAGARGYLLKDTTQCS